MINDDGRDARLLRFWKDFAFAAGIRGSNLDVLIFGDSKELADELAALVVSRAKRATTSLRREFHKLGRPIPKPGDFSIVVDGDRAPRRIVRTVSVDIKSEE